MKIHTPFLAILALWLGAPAVSHAADGPPRTRPNIVFIFIDDMGYADIGPFGNTRLRTPHLDTLARSGRKYTNYYAAPVCSMSRANLMTGSYNTRISMPSVIQPWNDVGLHPDERTLPEVLKQQGYATACFGKWHLGHTPEFMPRRHGFDEYLGIPYSNNMLAGYGPKKDTPPLPLYRNEEVVETEPDQSQFTRRFTEAAIGFIRARKDQPFFVYLPHPMIHTPLFASAGFKGQSADGILGDAIEEVDWSVGQIIAVLDELGLTKNTLVVFTSDNGPVRHPATPLRGQKTSCFEGGVRVPTIMSWPGKIPANTACGEILGTIDMLPTFARLSGAVLDPTRTIDGVDATGLLFDVNPDAVRDTHLYYGTGASPLVAIRVGDWKYFLKLNPLQTAGPLSQPGALFNLKDDIGESNDVAAQHPEIVARLDAEARKRHAEIVANQRPPGRSRRSAD